MICKDWIESIMQHIYGINMYIKMPIIPILHVIIKHKTTLYGVNNKLKIRYSTEGTNQWPVGQSWGNVLKRQDIFSDPIFIELR